MSTSPVSPNAQTNSFPRDVSVSITQYSFPFCRELRYALGLVDNNDFQSRIQEYEVAIYQEITRQIFDVLVPDFKQFVLDLKIDFNKLMGHQYFDKKPEIQSLIIGAVKEFSIGIWSELYRIGLLKVEGYDFYLNHVDSYIVILRTVPPTEAQV